MKSSKNVKINVVAKPAERVLLKHIDLYNAVDCLVINNCFNSTNLMRSPDDLHGVLFWDWAIVQIGDLVLPTPYHGVVFDDQGREYEFKAQDEILLQAYFYLTHLIGINHFRKSNELNMMIQSYMYKGLEIIDALGDEKIFELLEVLKNAIYNHKDKEFSRRAIRVLD